MSQAGQNHSSLPCWISFPPCSLIAITQDVSVMLAQRENPGQLGPRDKDWENRFYEALAGDPADEDLKHVRRTAKRRRLKADFLIQAVVRNIEMAVNQELKRDLFPPGFSEDALAYKQRLVKEAE